MTNSPLLKEVNYKYPLPKNFIDNEEFAIFKNYPPSNCTTPKVEILKNVRISNNSVVFKYFKIFEESCINQTNYQLYSKGLKFFYKFIFPKLNFSKKRFILITDEWTSNYYHWHNFALKKLVILQEHNLIDNSILLLPKKYQKYDFAMNSLKKFGIKENQIVYLRKKSNIKVKELPLITVTRQNPLIFRKIRQILTTNPIDLDFGEKIYISRQGQRFRFIENEEDVTNLLQKYGFRKILAEDFSHDEQISILSKAKYLVSPHGEGLTNLMFMKDGSNILEIATPQKQQNFNPDFYALASMLNLNYFHQVCQVGPNSYHKQDFHHGSLVVDIEKLEKNIKLMLQ